MQKGHCKHVISRTFCKPESYLQCTLKVLNRAPWRFMFDDDGHIWHSSGECLGINGGKLKKGQCATAELLVHMRSPCEIKP